MALTFGANDLDGVVREEKIYHTAGAVSPQMQSEGELIRLINEAGLTAVERDTFYQELKTSTVGQGRVVEDAHRGIS